MSELEEAQNAAGHLAHSRVARFWLRELPYIAVLALTILGVAYTSVSQPASHRLLGVSCCGDRACLRNHGMASHSRPQSSISDGLDASPPLAGFLGCDEHSAFARCSKQCLMRPRPG